MAGSPMRSRQRLLAAVRHEEPDRVPIAPRLHWAWIDPHGCHGLRQRYEPWLDPMEILSPRTPNYLTTYPAEYHLPEVRVTQRRWQDEPYEVVDRTFQTPAGTLRDVTRIPPAGREYGMAPNPIKAEYLVKSRDDLPALHYLLPTIDASFDHVVARQRELGEDGVVLVNIFSELCHQAGDARAMQDLMQDYYLDRPLFDELLAIFQQRTLAQARAALEAGVEWIFANNYYNSVSAGWSPAHFAEVFAPHVRQLVGLTHSYGALVDYYDDGHLAQTMGTLADCGVDVLETCTPPPLCDFDLATAKASIGDRVCLKGYIDLLYVVLRGSPELVEQTVAGAMAIGKPGGGLILGSSDSFREGTPPENLVAYFEACRRHGVY